ncbi:D-isomer specific 2-hydroxyacid dehydrogenase NAD-binding protein [Desulfurispirillum indicum S5]|uniref:D-isomer specific 2-hydroxyacid dehydrogenase NAD-binding protein n=1 Tax=Desulfurispirillum indicum (strain ATCC BAA-1389 / DSM 22839 / S5) TaxID=653733 RepID=E6W5L5_DESIS|nr:NAD(P)-dependent oxidoreductase [Desulfurispirillum indicum]ADU66046.1 D-isomer specific 2-hydroxyacid dehydrogenase NAD-binding protein [Desulfurispirillum indicum S5]
MRKRVARLTISPRQFQQLVPFEQKTLESAGFAYTCVHHEKGEIPHPAVRDAHVIIPNTSYAISAEVLAYFPNLEGILIPNSGYDHVDMAAVADRRIRWQHLPVPRSIDVSESTIMMMLDLLRKSSSIYQSMQQGHWVRNQIRGTGRLHGKDIGIIGYGVIGRRVSGMLKSFEPRSLGYYDPFVAADEVYDHAVQRYSDLKTLLSSCSVVSLHCSLTTSSQNMIDDEALSHLQPGSYLLNTARGKVVDESAVQRALNGGILAGYAADVFQDEPLGANHWMRSHPQVLCTPHIAGYTFEMLEQLVEHERAALISWYPEMRSSDR